MTWSGDFTELEEFLRGWRNARGDVVPYDAIGLMHLLLALVDNLRENGLEQDLEDLCSCISDDQARYLSQLLARAHR